MGEPKYKADVQIQINDIPEICSLDGNLNGKGNWCSPSHSPPPVYVVLIFYKDNHVPSYPNSPHHLECTVEPHSQGQKSEDEGFYSSSRSITMNNSTPSKPESIFQLSLKHENTAQLHTDCQGVHKLLIPNINPLPIITGSH